MKRLALTAIGLILFASVIAFTFEALRGRNRAIVVGGTAVAAIVTYPIAILVVLFMACGVGLGCI